MEPEIISYSDGSALNSFLPWIRRRWVVFSKKTHSGRAPKDMGRFGGGRIDELQYNKLCDNRRKNYRLRRHLPAPLRRYRNYIYIYRHYLFQRYVRIVSRYHLSRYLKFRNRDSYRSYSAMCAVCAYIFGFDLWVSE